MRRAWTAVSVALPVLAVGAELKQKFTSGWRPTGDDAIFAIHAHDVFSAKSPLLGTYSVVTQSVGKPVPPVYHLGPMVSWALAIPERWFSQRMGLAVGAGLVNLAMLLAVVLLVRRIASARTACFVSAALVMTVWSVGRNTLAEPWNPYIGLWALPLLVALGVAWASCQETASTLPALALVASFAVQAQYLFLGPVAAVVACALILRGSLPRGRPLIATGFVLCIAWLPALAQQVVGSPGNLSSWWIVTTASTEHASSFGSFSLWFLVNTVGPIPVGLRGPLSTGQLMALGHSPSLLTWFVNGLLLVSLITGAGCLWRTRRAVAVFAALAMALSIGTAFTLSRYPVPLVSFPYYRIVMCWVVSTVVWGACLACLLSLIPATRWPRIAIVSATRMYERFLLMPLMVVIALIVTGAQSPHEPVDALGARATQHLAAQTLRSLARTGGYVVRGDGARGVFVVYGLFRELLLDGRRVYVRNDEVQLRRDYGVGTRPAATIVVSSGSLTGPPGARILASYDGRTTSERKDFESLLLRDTNNERFALQQAQFVVYLLPQ